MAYSESATIVSFIAGATFSSGDQYKGLVVASNGQVTLPTTTGDQYVIGTLYSGKTRSTSASTGVEAVSVAVGGVVKVRMANSTLAAGSVITFSSKGLGIAATTDSGVGSGIMFGIVKEGSSGTTGRIHSVIVARS